jgi:hypothetical protein
MKLPNIFIASSSEGLNIVNAVQTGLLQKMDQKIVLRPWTREFDLSKTYIESLEKQSGEIDFALIVMTPDDITTSRKLKKPAPRDNVVFELGLFMGTLGRERCFIIHEDLPKLKLPTDLLGIMAATYKPAASKSLKAVLDKACSQVSERIIKLGTRRKLSPAQLAVQAEIYSFSNKIEGAWRERIRIAGENAISFFQIEINPLLNSVSLSGKSYNKEGIQVSSWDSFLSRVGIGEYKILYLWEGSPLLVNANVPKHGFGEMKFDKPKNPQDPIMRGEGKFWDVDEFHPEKTLIKPMQIKRIPDEEDIAVMTGGNEKEIKGLVKKTLAEW